MKQIVLAVTLMLGCSPAFAGELRDIFKRNHDQLLDWAIASSVETVVYYDMVNGRTGYGAQIPVVYTADGIVSGDLGYVTFEEGNDTRTRGNLAPGVSIRLNRILDIYFPSAAKTAKDFNETSENWWHKLFGGPAYTYLVTEKEHIAWLKLGLSF